MKLSEHNKHLNILSGIKPLGQQLGCGRFGMVYAVKYAGMTCAAKEIHSFQSVNPIEKQKLKQKFEELCYSEILSHPNIVHILGIYYPSQNSFPAIVTELMDISLSAYLNNLNNNLSKKVSILHDIAMGLNFLHARTPPVVHGYLCSDNILLKYTKDGMFPIAKIANLSMAKIVGSYTVIAHNIQNLVTVFTPPEMLLDPNKHSTFSDVFSFGCVALHIFSQWPIPITPTTSKGIHSKKFTEIKRREMYLDMITEEVTTLKPLIEACLNEVPEYRPSISVLLKDIKQLIVCMRITN